MVERSKTQYQTSLRLTLLSEETLSTNKEVYYAWTGRRRTCRFIHNITCNYRDLHGEMIHDRIILGLRDSNLSERLQTDPELTLDKAIMMAR